jgi:2-polyprenyl-6-hydroxyphenyl methylase/3-demethylubiquinone-9 3-methyltransferase
MSNVEALARYRHRRITVGTAHAYLFPTVLSMLSRVPAGTEVFDLGCGNGATAAELVAQGYRVTGVDPSSTGIAIAQACYPQCRLEQGSSDDDLAARFGTFDALISLEVVEHVYSPRRYVTAIDALLRPGGIAVISTPYHGYLKNLALAVTNRMDRHFLPLWEGGHIKFWSKATLNELFRRAGFQCEAFARVGRIQTFAKSMVALYRKPEAARHV